MSDVTVRMTSGLFQHARHYGVVLPGQGETVELPEAGAAELVKAKHAELVKAESEAEANEPEKPAENASEAEPVRRGPGRPPKNGS